MCAAQPITQSIKRYFSLFIVIYLLASCGETELTREWRKYPERIANLTDTSLKSYPDALNQIRLSPADKKQYHIQINAIELNLFKALSISDCNLQRYVGERNSSLGKVHTPTNRLIYERQLLDSLNFCTSINESAHQLILTQLKTKKNNNWPAIINNYLLNSEPSTTILASSSTLLESDSTGFNASLHFIEQLTRFTQTQQAVKSDTITQFKLSAAQLYNRAFLSRLFYTLEYTSYQLNQVTWLLQKQINKQACKTNFKPVEIEYLHNVFIKYYASILQPHLTKLNRMQLQLAPKIAKLWQHSRIQQSQFGQRYLNNAHDSVFHEFELSIKNHTQNWQTLLKQCQLMPTS
ncbi:DUF3080 family protein [Catenovulum adriaticum]|uniref:DUF3080 domain-containing protein n=1 Tax=Catenovulum adriaticum TaxID=2984846 RepID=A0ABY7ARI5_9ALTE|nr:DUF3080 family protein [Catenovulum sp. TS8]WAJ71281.1 DUF3080 domain-containing protein [Catenovulum sp. TS8]